MKKIEIWLWITCWFCLRLYAEEPLFHSKTVIVGSGIIGAIEAYHTYINAVKNNKQVQVVVYEKGCAFEEGALTNTAYHICPSLTPDEILSVVPRGGELVEKLGSLFSESGGIRVDDIAGANDSLAAMQFKQRVACYGEDPHHEKRTQHLLMMGKRSMELWNNLYDEADPELKKILEQSNFNVCREQNNHEEDILHDGYRIDLIYEVNNAKERAEGMQKTYQELGYDHSKLLSPDEVMKLDPALHDFCMMYSKENDLQERVWNKDTAALWRPGGCLSTHDFLPAFYAYLKKIMGVYIDATGDIQDCFRLEFNKEVVEVIVNGQQQLLGLKFQDGSFDHNSPAECNYVFCPGESVGTLKKLGFNEPAYAGFAGPSLMLSIPLSAEELNTYKNFNHCMEVHKVGIVLAWQGRCKGDRMLLQVGDSKAFYGDQIPQIYDDFAVNRHLVQLNMINEVLPEMVSIACGKNTKKSELTFDDLAQLEEKGILNRWVGRRAVAYDGFPTLGALFMDGLQVKNARCTTHMGSGGVSFAPAAVQISQSFKQSHDPLTTQILHYADSRR